MGICHILIKLSLPAVKQYLNPILRYILSLKSSSSSSLLLLSSCTAGNGRKRTLSMGKVCPTPRDSPLPVGQCDSRTLVSCPAERMYAPRTSMDLIHSEWAFLIVLTHQPSVRFQILMVLSLEHDANMDELLMWCGNATICETMWSWSCSVLSSSNVAGCVEFHIQDLMNKSFEAVMMLMRWSSKGATWMDVIAFVWAYTEAMGNAVFSISYTYSFPWLVAMMTMGSDGCSLIAVMGLSTMNELKGDDLGVHRCIVSLPLLLLLLLLQLSFKESS